MTMALVSTDTARITEEVSRAGALARFKRSDALFFWAARIAAWLVLRHTEGQGGLGAFWQGLSRWRLGAAGWALTLLSPLVFLALAAGLITLQTGAPPSSQALASGRLGSLPEVLDLILVAALLQAAGSRA